MGTPFSPGDLADAGKAPFILSRAEWLSIQRYVTNAMALPVTEQTMRDALAMPDETKFDEFKPLLAGYKTIVPHVTKWKTHTFKNTVDLASDIVHYAALAETYYGGLLPTIEALLTNPEDAAAKRRLSGSIKQMAKEAQERADKAGQVYKDIEEFSHQTATDAVLIDSLSGTYQAKFGANSEWGKKLAGDLTELRDLIETTLAEYEYDKAVACSTPAYAWIVVPPIGLIAAIIVAGIYGDKAVKARQRLEDLRKDLATAKADQKLAFMLTTMLTVARDGLANIQRDIRAALPVIQKIQGVWQGIHADLGNVVHLIDQNIDQAILEIKDMGVEAAIKQWKTLSSSANAYRINAVIEVPKNPNES